MRVSTREAVRIALIAGIMVFTTTFGSFAQNEGRWEAPRWSLKTNGLAWIATIPNITGEYRISDHVAVDLSLYWCPWKASERYSLKVAGILPEARYWLNDEAYGHYFNLHLSCAWYNFSFNNYRYQDAHRPAIGAGLGYGYQFRFTENWGLDLSIGLGYINTLYDRFYNIPNGAWIDRRRTGYWGIDRLGVSVTYCFTR